MTKQIWKFPVGSIEIEMPDRAEFLYVREQNGRAMAWFMVVPENPRVFRKFNVYGTGHGIPMSETYLGSWQSSPFEWHLFEVNQK